jgi:hypothetical protein
MSNILVCNSLYNFTLGSFGKNAFDTAILPTLKFDSVWFSKERLIGV